MTITMGWLEWAAFGACLIAAVLLGVVIGGTTADIRSVRRRLAVVDPQQRIARARRFGQECARQGVAPQMRDGRMVGVARVMGSAGLGQTHLMAAGSDLPPRGAGVPVEHWEPTDPAPEPEPEPEADPEWADTLKAARELEHAALGSIADAYDTESMSDDEPPREDGWVLGSRQHDDQDDEPGPPEPVSPAAVPRYDWSQARPVNPQHGVAPGLSRYIWHRRATRWLDGPRAVPGRVRRYVAQRVRKLTAGPAAAVAAARSATAAGLERIRTQPHYVGRHSAEATGSWSWSEIAARRKAEIAELAAKYEHANRTGATWSQQLALMWEALQPPKRTIPPTRPYIGCAP